MSEPAPECVVVVCARQHELDENKKKKEDATVTLKLSNFFLPKTLYHFYGKLPTIVY